MKALQEPFRYDYVGSFLRPEKVKNAKVKLLPNRRTWDFM